MQHLPMLIANTMDSIIELYGGIIGSVVKQNANFVEWSLITGILLDIRAGSSSPINNVIDYPFSEKVLFSDFYNTVCPK